LFGVLSMTPVCLFGLLYQMPILWALCPQSLALMFLRQAMGPPDSLGAAAVPELVVAAFYYPLIGKLLLRGIRHGVAIPLLKRISCWHLIAVAIAIGMAAFRNYVWTYRLDS